MTKFLLILLLLTFPFGQLTRWEGLGPQTPILLNDIVVSLVVIVGLWFKRKKLSTLLRDPLTKPIGFFVAAMALSLVVNFLRFPLNELAIASLYLLRWAAYAGLYFVFSDPSVDQKSQVRSGLILAAVAIAVAGLFQYVFMPDVSWISEFSWDSHYFRLISVFLDPNFTGIILVLGLLLSVDNFKNFTNFRNFLLIVLLYLALALTYSRASFLVYLVVSAVVAFVRRSIKLFLIAATILALTLPLLPKSTGVGTDLSRENSTSAKLENWKQSMAIWRQSPVFGSGFDTYRYISGASSSSHSGAGADSTLLLILATTGIVGLLAYLNLLKTMWTVGKTDLLIMASLAAIFVHSWFDNSLLYPWVMEWLWLLLATRGNI